MRRRATCWAAMAVLLCGGCAPRLPRLAAPVPRLAAPGGVARVPDAGRLRVGSFNAWLLPVAADDVSARMRRMPAAIAALRLDVLCLQEVWLVGFQIELERSLKAHFPHTVRSDGGLMVLSRFPITYRKFHPFPAVGGLPPTEWIANKGVLETVVQTPGGPIRVVTTHMALDIGGEQKGRRAQLRALGARVCDWNDVPLIVAGDFNAPPSWNDKMTPDYRAILKWGMSDTNPPEQRPDGSYRALPPTRVGWPPARRDYILFQWAIDYILYRNAPGGGPVLSATGQRLHFTEPHASLSDHHLLAADFVYQ